MVAQYHPVYSYNQKTNSLEVEHKYQVYMTYTNKIDSTYTISFNITAPDKGLLDTTFFTSVLA